MRTCSVTDANNERRPASLLMASSHPARGRGISAILASYPALLIRLGRDPALSGDKFTATGGCGSTAAGQKRQRQREKQHHEEF